jgi:outer membrane protein TolC
MPLSRTLKLCAALAVVFDFTHAFAQTSTLNSFDRANVRSGSLFSAPNDVRPPAVAQSPLQQPVLFQEQFPLASRAMNAESRLAGESTLSLPLLITEVQAQNPTIEAMAAAWRAAAQRYPQAVALEDPMFMAMAAPASFGSSDVESAYVLEASQKIPWFGKRDARGRVAQAEARAARGDMEATRLLLAEAAQLAYFDYYLAFRRQDLITRNIDVMREFRQTAETRYRANQVTQRDMIQADVELVELDRRKIEAEKMKVVAAARINTLLRRAPQAALPPPPLQLTMFAGTLDQDTLQQVAIQQRPDLAALADRVRAEEAAVAVACKDYYPDSEIFGRYDSFWQPADTQSDLRGQVGVRVNLPIYKGRLDAAVREALFRLGQRRAEYEQKVLDVRYEVQTAFAQLEESRQSLALYSDKLLPFVEQNVNAARSNYDVGKDSFLDLAVAQRQLIEVREKREEALTDYNRRLAELTRAIGGPVPGL